MGGALGGIARIPHNTLENNGTDSHERDNNNCKHNGEYPAGRISLLVEGIVGENVQKYHGASSFLYCACFFPL